MAVDYFNTPTFPTLSPEDFISRAVFNGLNLQQAFWISGASDRSWKGWLYQGKRPTVIWQERLWRVANERGWV